MFDRSNVTMDYESIKDKKIALVIYNTEKENDAHVYLGKIIEDSNELFFVNEIRKWKISIDAEKLDRLRLVTEDLKQILLDADYCFSFSMGSIPDEDSKEDYVFTGIKWH